MIRTCVVRAFSQSQVLISQVAMSGFAMCMDRGPGDGAKALHAFNDIAFPMMPFQGHESLGFVRLPRVKRCSRGFAEDKMAVQGYWKAGPGDSSRAHVPS